MNFLPGVGEEIGPELVGSPDVDVIAFTGSREVGLEINRSAAETLTAGTERFRALPLSSLMREELADSTPDPAMNRDVYVTRDESCPGFTD